jgi:RNA polymerase sigma-70 factor, ECF subfamily
MSSLLNPDAGSADYREEIGAEPADGALLELTARGDEAAFALLYARYSVGVFNYLLRLLHEQAYAEELLQEVFVAVWQAASGFRSRSSVKTWIYRIAHNQAVSRLRGIRREWNYLQNLGHSPAEDGVESQASVAWQADQVTKAMNKLSHDHRAVVELYFVHGLSYAEVAAVVGCPVGTVKSRMSYAIRYLAGMLRAEGLDEV